MKYIIVIIKMKNDFSSLKKIMSPGKGKALLRYTKWHIHVYTSLKRLQERRKEGVLL